MSVVLITDGVEEVLDDYTSIEEEAADLRSRGLLVALDTSRVPAELRDESKLLEFQFIISLYMQDESYRAAVCLHEAAHAEYMERRGADFVQILPPSALIRNGKLTYVDAAVTDSKNAADAFVADDEEIVNLDYVKEIIAAGIAEEKLLGQPTDSTGGDDDDLQAAFDTNNVPEEERKRLKDQARKEIVKDLRSPKFRHDLWARARFYQRAFERTLWLNPDQTSIEAAA